MTIRRRKDERKLYGWFGLPEWILIAFAIIAGIVWLVFFIGLLTGGQHGN